MNHLPTKRRKIHPKDEASMFSQLLFIHILPILKRGYRRQLEEEDLYKVPSTFQSGKLGELVQQASTDQRTSRGNVAIFLLLWNIYGKKYFILGFTQLIVGLVVIIIQPEVLAKFTTCFSSDQEKLTKFDALYYAAIVITINAVEGIFTNNYCLLQTGIGVKARAALCSAIYRKSLKTKPNLSSSTGRLVTLITKDAQSIEGFVNNANSLWIGIVNTAVSCILLYNKIGVATLVPLGIFIIAMPLQVYMGAWATNLRKEICEKTERRLQKTKELLTAIKLIKMCIWEKCLTDEIIAERKKEVLLIFKMTILKLFILVIGTACRFAGFLAMFSTYIWLDNSINSEVLFFTIRCYQFYAFPLSDVFPNGVTQMAEFYASINRIGEFLNTDEINKKPETKSASPRIILKNVTITMRNKKILTGVNLNLGTGLTILTGPVGSGKSVLLLTILQDYKPAEGKVEVKGRISYASQTLWLFPSTIKQNILFGEALNEVRYQEVVEVCALQYDFELLADGDDTILEDHGHNLSKGQKARINLARAIYRDRDIYLLDDCLAALDSSVGNYIFEECILKFLKNKLVILIAHSYLTNVNNVVLLENGTIKYIRQSLNVNKELNLKFRETKVKKTKDKFENSNESSECSALLRRASTYQTIHHDVNRSGQVSYSVYWNYVQLGGGFLAVVAVSIVFALTQVANSMNDKVTSQWVDSKERNYSCSLQDDLSSTECKEHIEPKMSLLHVSIIWGTMNAILVLCRGLTLFAVTRRASILLHQLMITKIANARINFFDTNLVGNILNRFSKDLTTIDENIPFVLHHVTAALFLFIGIIVVLASVNLTLLIPTLFFLLIIIMVRLYYLPTARSLKRLDASTRSPLIGHFNATLEGLTTVRNFQVENVLIDEFDKHQDLYTSANFTLETSMRAFTFWLNNFCTLFITMIMTRFLIFFRNNLAAEVGLAVNQAFAMTEKLQWGVWEWAEIENQMTSVERVLEYDKITQETGDGLIAVNWLKQGEIVYKDVSLSIKSSGVKILKNLNFTIQPMEKIGIVGRTGAGKSSLISTLFRLYEIEGKIAIDGIDIRTISLESLRSHISIIPQDPALFSGTIRENIDLEQKYSDKDIWAAIEASQLKSVIDNLDYEVTDTYFSVGQRQLICLARAILRQNKIVVLDEATANIDPKTEDLILNIIQTNFISCTMLIIAHRLKSILNCDKIMVLEQGEIKEFGRLADLIKVKDGIFFNMVQTSGLALKLHNKE